MRYLDDFENLVVTYRRKAMIRPEDKPRVARIEQRYEELYDRYYAEGLSESEKQKLLEEMEPYQEALDLIEAAGKMGSKNTSKYLHYDIRDPNPDPRHVIIEEDLGVIEYYINFDKLFGDLGK